MSLEDRYGPLDRLLHRVAFRAGLAQRTVAELEEAIYRDTLRSITVDDPVFITALPRSGTTILLKVLVETGRFASHIYRDMPFVLCPLLWRRFSRHFAVDDAPRERFHGDGLRVSPDSPEAFEEMIWKHFWPDHYGEDRVRPWDDEEARPEFDEFFTVHMRKVVALRRRGPGERLRYLSKNNLNIARLASPPEPLRSGRFVVPFREPVQQAASMLRQHRRFREIHRRDGFVREYMEAIGHHEFGEGLKPVDFGGWLDRAEEGPDRLGFWLRYWVAAYRFAAQNAGPSTAFVDYGRLTSQPEAALRRLADVVDVARPELAALADRLRPPRTHETDTAGLPRSVRDAADDLHRRLREASAV